LEYLGFSTGVRIFILLGFLEPFVSTSLEGGLFEESDPGKESGSDSDSDSGEDSDSDSDSGSDELSPDGDDVLSSAGEEMFVASGEVEVSDDGELSAGEVSEGGVELSLGDPLFDPVFPLFEASGLAVASGAVESVPPAEGVKDVSPAAGTPTVVGDASPAFAPGALSSVIGWLLGGVKSLLIDPSGNATPCELSNVVRPFELGLAVFDAPELLPVGFVEFLPFEFAAPAVLLLAAFALLLFFGFDVLLLAAADADVASADADVAAAEADVAAADAELAAAEADVASADGEDAAIV
jgi:hypothetical protein